MRVLSIVESVVDALIAHCRAALPDEACGLIGGEGDVALSCYPLRNVAADPREGFWGHPGDQMQALRRIEEAGERLLAVYHSHPRTSPVPSRADLAEAAYMDALMVIVGLIRPAAPQIRVYRIHPERRLAVAVRWRRIRAPRKRAPR